MENKIVEFGNYLLSLNNDKEKELYIYGSVINHPNKNIFIYLLSPEDEAENRVEIIDGKEVKLYSQINHWIEVFGLDVKENDKLKLKEYLDVFLEYKKDLKL
jgi:hypothetical protein